jgi:hypothetical protein
MAHSVFDVKSTFIELLFDYQTLSIQCSTSCHRMYADRRPSIGRGGFDFQSTVVSCIILVDDDNLHNFLEFYRLSQSIHPSTSSNIHTDQIIQIQRLRSPTYNRTAL